MTVRQEVLSVNGWTLNVQRKGHGAPVVVLHGEDDGAQWSPWMDQLAEGAEVIVPEHPGFGDIDHPEWLTSVGDLAYFYLDYLKTARLESVHLIGLSLGGWAAAELAVRATARLSSLTLVSSTGIHLPGIEQVDAFLGDEKQQIRDLFYDPALADQMIAARTDPTREDLVLRQRLTTARLTWQPRNYNPHLAKWLHRIDIPTLLIWGDTDRYFPKDYASAFASLIPKSKVSVLSRCGHLPQVERSNAFSEIVKSFIAKGE